MSRELLVSTGSLLGRFLLFESRAWLTSSRTQSMRDLDADTHHDVTSSFHAQKKGFWGGLG